MADVDARRLVCAAVLVEEPELGRDGAGEREQDAEIQRQVKKKWSFAAHARPGVAPRLPRPSRGPPGGSFPLIGPQCPVLEDLADGQTIVGSDEKLHCPAAPADRRGWRGVPFRLHPPATCRADADRSRWRTPSAVAARGFFAAAAVGQVRVRLVHWLGGARRGAPAAPAGPARRLAAPDVRPLGARASWKAQWSEVVPLLIGATALLPIGVWPLTRLDPLLMRGSSRS